MKILERIIKQIQLFPRSIQIDLNTSSYKSQIKKLLILYIKNKQKVNRCS